MDQAHRQLDGGDYHDYRMMRDQLADEVTIDFGGVQPRLTQTAEALVQYAQNVHGKLNVVQHHVMNQQVEISGDEATCLSKGIAYHEHPVSLMASLLSLRTRASQDRWQMENNSN